MSPFGIALIFLLAIFLLGATLSLSRRQFHWLALGFGMSIKSAAAASVLLASAFGKQIQGAQIFFFSIVALFAILLVVIGAALRAIRFQGIEDPAEQKEIRN